MTLNRQSNVLVWLAAAAVLMALGITLQAAFNVRNETHEIEMAENTVKGVSSFRFLVMETAFYHEHRSSEQWQKRVTSFRAMLSGQRYDAPYENLLLDREKTNLEILARLYDKLISTTSATDARPADVTSTERTATTVSALFLTTQDMLDDAFELQRLNSIGLTNAQDHAGFFTALNILVLAALIAAASVIIKQRVVAPIADLQVGTERVTQGDLSYRLKLNVRNEIGVLARTFDSMTEQLEQSRSAMRATVQTLQDKSAELAKAQKELQIIIDHMPALVVYWDTQLLNRFANSAYVEWFGVTPEQMHGKHIRDIVGEARFRQIEPRLLSVLRGNTEVFELAVESRSGAKRQALFSYVPDFEDGKQKGFYGFISDVTQLRQAQAAQEEALAQLQGIVDAAIDFSIIQTDVNGIIRLFSSGAERMLGYTAAEMVDENSLSAIHMSEEVVARGDALTEEFGRPIQGFDVFTELPRQGKSESREWTYVRKDGTTLPVNLTATSVRDQYGSITGFVGIAKDIREDKRILQALADARDEAQAASVSKGQFLANMSHEIRTPMNAILGMLQLLQHTDLTARQLDYATKTQTAARSLLGLLNDILDFSKVEAGKMTMEYVPFRFDNLMRELSVILSANIGDKDIEVLFSIDPELPPCVFGDALRLRQVLLNLAGNAIKFTERGEVIVSLNMVAHHANRTEIALAVQDTGIGIAPAQLAHIFQGFSQAEASTTRRFGGTGLGLAISQRLVSLIGGELKVESTPGVGSRFYFNATFERASDDESIKLSAPVSLPMREPVRVLIVDDNQAAREVSQAMIESLGWYCKTAASGSDALAILHESIATDTLYDVVFVDWQMPEMDGWEVAHEIRKLQDADHAPVIIMVTAHGREALAKHIEDEHELLGGFLVKPITASMLFDAVIEASSGLSHSATRVRGQAGAARLAGLRLLVVEDTLVNQQVARELLLGEGASVEIAAGGGSGVEKTLQADPPFDAVLMDIQMPDMDGYTATRKIREHAHMQSLPIIAMTANAMPADKAACIAAGMNDHIGKPIDLDGVVQTILRYCRSPGPAQTRERPNLKIDLDAALQRLGNNKPLYASLIGHFATDTATMPQDFQYHLQQGDHAKASGLMHALKGIASTLGATQLAEYASEIETKIDAADSTMDAMQVVDDLQWFIAQSKGLLEAIANVFHAPSPQSVEDASPLDVAALKTMLDDLDVLLQGANMQARSVFTMLQQRFGPALGPGFKPLSEAMNRLDFKSASASCALLRASLS